jgi:hypothetical protein
MTEPSEHITFLTQWRLVRSAIEHENTLKSHRVTWFLATQLFLFTGFTSIFVEAVKSDFLFRSLKVYAALVIIFLMGIYVCVLAWVNLRAAQKMIARLQNWWLIHCRNTSNDLEGWIMSVKYGKGQQSFPPVNGMFTSNMHVIFDEIQLPVALAAFWLVLFIVTTIIVFQKRFEACKTNNFACFFPPAIVILMILVILTLCCWHWKKIKKRLKNTNARSSKEFGLIGKKLKLIDDPLDPQVKTALDKHPCE